MQVRPEAAPATLLNSPDFNNITLSCASVSWLRSHAERDEFEKYDLEHGIRRKFVEDLQREFPDYGLKYSIGA